MWQAAEGRTYDGAAQDGALPSSHEADCGVKHRKPGHPPVGRGNPGRPGRAPVVPPSRRPKGLQWGLSRQKRRFAVVLVADDGRFEAERADPAPQPPCHPRIAPTGLAGRAGFCLTCEAFEVSVQQRAAVRAEHALDVDLRVPPADHLYGPVPLALAPAWNCRRTTDLDPRSAGQGCELSSLRWLPETSMTSVFTVRAASFSIAPPMNA